MTRTAVTFALYSTFFPGQPFRREILWIIDNKRLFVVGFYAGQVISELLLHTCAAESYVDIFDVDVFLFGVVDELSLKTNRDRISRVPRGRSSTGCRAAEASRKSFDHAVDVFVGDRPNPASSLDAFVLSQLNLWQNFDTDVKRNRILADSL